MGLFGKKSDASDGTGGLDSMIADAVIKQIATGAFGKSEDDLRREVDELITPESLVGLIHATVLRDLPPLTSQAEAELSRLMVRMQKVLAGHVVNKVLGRSCLGSAAEMAQVQRELVRIIAASMPETSD